MPRRSDDGFSLIEGLAALAILALAGVGLVGATEAHIRQIAGLETRAMAGLAAQNRAVELAVGALPLETNETRLSLGGTLWRVRQEIEDTNDEEFARVSIEVFLASENRRYARLIAFADRRAAP